PVRNVCRLWQQVIDDEPALAGQLSQPVARERSLCLLQRLGDLDEAPELTGSLARQLIDKPGTRGRPGQLLDRGRILSLPCLAGLPGTLITRSGEFRRRQRIELVSNLCDWLHRS